MSTGRRSRRSAQGASWLDRLLVAVIVCAATPSAAAITQVLGKSLPADAYAHPYAQPPVSYHVRGQVDGGAVTAPPPTASATAAATARPAPVCLAPAYRRWPGLPAHDPIIVLIPRLGVVAAVEQASLDRHGDMQVPKDSCDVAWYRRGPVPGAPGDAVIDGHLDWYGIPSVFWNLGKLTKGQEIDVIEAGGGELRFGVADVRHLRAGTTDTGLFAATGQPMLSLYTCAGDWEPWAQTYSQRVIVDALPLRH